MLRACLSQIGSRLMARGADRSPASPSMTVQIHARMRRGRTGDPLCRQHRHVHWLCSSFHRSLLVQVLVLVYVQLCTHVFFLLYIEKYQFSQPNHRENHGKQQITRASSVHQPPQALQNATPHFNVSCLDDYLCSFALVFLVQPPAPGMVKREPLW